MLWSGTQSSRALLEEAESEAEAAEGRARELTAEVEASDAPLDTAALEVAIAEAQGDGQVESRLAQAQDELADAHALLDAALSEIEPAADVDALRVIRPPSAATIERFRSERDELDERARKLGDRRERLEGERRDLDEDQGGWT